MRLAIRSLQKVLIICAQLMMAAFINVYGQGGDATDLNVRGLPDRINPSDQDSAIPGSLRWTIDDAVQITRIREVAVSNSRQVAFLLQQSLVRSDEVQYGLFVIGKDGSARKLQDSTYMGNLSWDPKGDDCLTLRADFGQGVQLYKIDLQGHASVLVASKEMAFVGGYHLIGGDFPNDQETGIVSYEWSPDGSALWYVKVRLRTPAAQRATDDAGITWDDHRLASTYSLDEFTKMEGTELHVMIPGVSDDVIYFRPWQPSRGDWVGVQWQSDSRHIEFHHDYPKDMQPDQPWIFDVKTGEARAAPMNNQSPDAQSGTHLEGYGYLFAKRQEDGHHFHLILLGEDGREKKDYGAVSFSLIGDHWWNKSESWGVYTTVSRDRDGISTFPPSDAGKKLEAIADNLSDCAFTKDVSYGICVRESLTLAPELVSVFPADGTIATIIRPNARYDAIEPLHSVYQTWTNRFGAINAGYITYPRNYTVGTKYPVLLFNHAQDARNQFVDNGFQWDYPVQVMAERGYLVLSVNGPYGPAPTGTNFPSEIDKKAFGRVNGLASMEASVDAVVKAGLADPERVGIAGYSFGSWNAQFALTQSKVFKAGSGADMRNDASGYLDFGYFGFRNSMHDDMGGSPFDPRVFPNYEKYSSTVRASQFNGPFLQQFAASTASLALEMHELLLDAKIPSELVIYPREEHLFYEPRHRASAMELNVLWFDYWLLGKKDPDPKYEDRCTRWDAVAEEWKKSRNVESTPPQGVVKEPAQN